MGAGERHSGRHLLWLVALLVGGLAVRLALAHVLGRRGFTGDLDIFGSWAIVLADHGPAHFYTAHYPDLPKADNSDHLPGDLWMVWLVGLMFRTLSPQGTVGDPGLVFLIKLVPILADVAIASLLYAIGRELAGKQAGLVAAGLYALNPAPIFLSSVWGQWDSLSAMLLLLAVWCLMRGWVATALPVLTLTALIKPQLAVVGGVALLGFFLHGHRHALWRQVFLGGFLSLTLLILVTVPFNTPPWPTDHDLYDQAREALNRYKGPTVGAFNFWSLWEGVRPSGSDAREFALGVDYRTWGLALLGLAILGALVRLVGARHVVTSVHQEGREVSMELGFLFQRPDNRRLLLACCVTAVALFALPTREHERYLLPAVALTVVLAAVEKRYLGVAAVLSLSLFANLYWIYDHAYGLPSFPLLTGSAGITICALVNMGALAALLLFPTGAQHEGTPSVVNE